MRCQKYFRTFFTLKKSSLDSKTCKNIVKNKRRRPHPNQKTLQKKTYRRKHIPKRRRTNNKQAGAWRRILTKKKRKRKGRKSRRKSWLYQRVMSNKNKRTTEAVVLIFTLCCRKAIRTCCDGKGCYCERECIYTCCMCTYVHIVYRYHGDAWAQSHWIILC